MCKTGGPRCPQTPGKRARVKFNRNIQKLVASSDQTTDDWKTVNASEYDALLRETFPQSSAQNTEDDLSWLNYRDMQQEDEYEVTEPDEDFAEEIDWDDLVSDDPAVVSAFLDKAGMNFENVSEDFSSFTMSQPNTSSYEDEEDQDEPITVERKHYEASTNKHLLPDDAEIISPTPNPVFVYGTLRSGHGNFNYVLSGKVTKTTEANLPGSSMYSNGGFPYVIEEEEGMGVKGELMYLDYDEIVDTMDSLDTLEGTRDLTNDYNLYNRHLRYVHVGDNKYVQAWVYMPPASNHENVKRLPQVDTGDWSTYDRFRR